MNGMTLTVNVCAQPDNRSTEVTIGMGGVVVRKRGGGNPFPAITRLGPATVS